VSENVVEVEVAYKLLSRAEGPTPPRRCGAAIIIRRIWEARINGYPLMYSTEGVEWFGFGIGKSSR